MKETLTLFILWAIPLPSMAGWFGPGNYDECILESMKGVTSDGAARLIAKSCRQKFPDEPKIRTVSRALSDEELDRLAGESNTDHINNYLSGYIYNGNTNVTISEISINVKTVIDGKVVARVYTDEISIKPQSTRAFEFPIMTGKKNAGVLWSISGARGY